MIIECAIVSLAAVVVQSIRSAERIHRRQLEDDAAGEIDVAEVRRVLERDRAEWAAALKYQDRNVRAAATMQIMRIDKELLSIAGHRRR